MKNKKYDPYNPYQYAAYTYSGSLGHKVNNKKSISKTENVSFDSQIERIFYFYKKYIEGALIERNTNKHLTYTNTAGYKTYFYPDFIVNGVFYELKGLMSQDDIQKRQQHPEVQWIVTTESYGKTLLNNYCKELDKKLQNWRTL